MASSTRLASSANVRPAGLAGQRRQRKGSADTAENPITAPLLGAAQRGPAEDGFPARDGADMIRAASADAAGEYRSHSMPPPGGSALGSSFAYRDPAVNPAAGRRGQRHRRRNRGATGGQATSLLYGEEGDRLVPAMCIVCGLEEGHDGGAISLCVLDYKCPGCQGVARDPRLALRQGGHEDPDVSRAALDGTFGATAQCLGTRGGRVLLLFRRPRAWVRVGLLPRLRAAPAPAAVPADDAEWPARPAEPHSAAERAWALLAATEPTLRVARYCDAAGLMAVELNQALVWLPEDCIQRVAQWGGEFVRLAERDVIREHAGFGWKDWWADFELIVGRAVRVYPPNQGPLQGVTGLARNYRTVVSFAGGRAVITLPTDALRRATQKEESAEYLLIPTTITDRVMMAVMLASTPPVLALKGCMHATMFVWAAYSAADNEQILAGAGRDRGGAWEVYQDMYFKLFNSGYPTLIADCFTVGLYFVFAFRPTFHQFVTGIGPPFLVVISATLSIGIPAAITHAAPMVIFYGWLWLVFALVTYIFVRVALVIQPTNPDVPAERRFDMRYYLTHHRGWLTRSFLFFFICRLVGEVCAVVFIQTSFNYAVLTYRGHSTTIESQSSGYFGTLERDYVGRRVACTWEAAQKLRLIIF